MSRLGSASSGKVIEIEQVPTSGNNPSYLVSYNASDEPVYVDTIINGTTYRQTFTRSDMTVISTLPISSNVEI